jgi:hypothetical protein
MYKNEKSRRMVRKKENEETEGGECLIYLLPKVITPLRLPPSMCSG